MTQFIADILCSMLVDLLEGNSDLQTSTHFSLTDRGVWLLIVHYYGAVSVFGCSWEVTTFQTDMTVEKPNSPPDLLRRDNDYSLSRFSSIQCLDWGRSGECLSQCAWLTGSTQYPAVAHTATVYSVLPTSEGRRFDCLRESARGGFPKENPPPAQIKPETTVE